MTGCLISCVVPVYNGERHLGEAVDSILAQSWRPIEVIIVDDGSTDRTGDLADRIAERSPEVQVVAQVNAGPASARNTGLDRAKGELLCFLDADDLWHPEKLSRQANRFDRNPALDHCVHHIQNFWDEDLADEAKQYREHARGGPVAGYITQCLMARRRAFERIGGFDTHLQHGDSTDWFLRARRAGLSGELMPDVLAYRRMHRDNRSRVKASSSLEEFFGILKKSLDQKRASEGTS